MKIRVLESNRTRINTELQRVQSRCEVRLVDFDDIRRMIKTIEDRLQISKKSLEGCEAVVDIHAQNFPHAYKYTPDSTWVKLAYSAGCWQFIDAQRARTASEGHGYVLSLTPAAEAEILRHHKIF